MGKYDNLSVQQFLELKQEIDNKYSNEIISLARVLKNVKNTKLLDYKSEINELLESFKILFNLSSDTCNFDFKVRTYAKTGTRWYCESNLTNGNFRTRRLVDIIHIPGNTELGKRIEIILPKNIALRSLKDIFKIESVEFDNYGDFISLKFEDVEIILNILTVLKLDKY